ncbi:hypothetical protein BJX62DRAFT_190626 [Aspergillus germanicus]
MKLCLLIASKLSLEPCIIYRPTLWACLLSSCFNIRLALGFGEIVSLSTNQDKSRGYSVGSCTYINLMILCLLSLVDRPKIIGLLIPSL